MGRGSKTSWAKSKGKGKGPARGPFRVACPNDASCKPEPHPSQLQSPAEDLEVARGRAGEGAGVGPGGGSSRAAARVPPLPHLPCWPEEHYYSLLCGAMAARRKQAVMVLRPEPESLSLTERQHSDAMFLGTVGPAVRPKNARAGNWRGPCAKKVPEKSGSATGRAPQAAAGGQSKTGGQAASSSGLGGKAKKMAETPPAGQPPAMGGGAETLETVQQKLDAQDEEADLAYLRVLCGIEQMRLPFLERRKGLIDSIPGFWGQALQNHPQLAFFLSSPDKEVLSYLMSLEVEEVDLAGLGYKIKFYFGPNPYFENEVLIKEYSCNVSDQVISSSTAIQWLPGHDLHSMCQGNLEQNFFGWFVSRSSIWSDKITEAISEELWPNPLQYYLMSKGDCGEKAEEGQPDPPEQLGETPALEVEPST